MAVGLAILLAVPGAWAGFFNETFEEYLIVPTNVIAIGNGWGASSNTVKVVSNAVGNQAANIAPGESLWNTVSTNVTPNWIWTDLWLNQTNFVTPDTLPPVLPSTAFMVAFATNGCLYAVNPASNAWEVCSVNATNGPATVATTGSWARITVFQNYSNHTVQIFLNGSLIRTNWPFINTGLSSYGTFKCEGSADGNAFLDNVTVSNATPPGLNYSDINGNLMPDDMELTLYGSLNVWAGSTVLATVTNLSGSGTVTPTGTVTGIKYHAGTNFFLSADIGCVLDRVWTNGWLAATYDRQSKTNTYVWSDITMDGTFQVGFFYNGMRFVPGDYTTITGALAVALANDQIVVSNGTYAGSITLSNGVALVGTNMTLTAGNTNLVINGAMSVVQTGMVSFAGAQGQFTVTGQVSVAAGGVLTISNAAAIVTSLTIGAGGVVHVIDGALTVGSITKTGTFDVTLVTITASVSDAYGAISPTGTFSVITWYSNVTYTLTANEAYAPGTVTNNGVDVSSSLETLDVHHWRYTDAEITNNRAITAAFSYSGLRYVPGDYGTISAAVAAARGGDVILLASSNYNETVMVTSNLTFTGTGSAGLASLTVQAGVTNTLQGFTNFTAAAVTMASNGVMVVSNSVLNLTALTIQEGAIIHCYNSTATVNGVQYTANQFDLDQYWNLVLTAKPLNFTDGFETYSLSTPFTHLGPNGWAASTSAVMVVSNLYSSTTNSSEQVGQIPAGAVVSNLVTGTGHTKVWTDLLFRQTDQTDILDFINTNGPSPVVWFINTNGWLTVLTPTGWDICSNDVRNGSAPNVATGMWAEISWYMDFTPPDGKVSYFVNGHLVRQSLPFAKWADHISSLKWVADDATAWLDNVNIMTNLPAGVTNWPAGGLDVNLNGILDAMEIHLYGALVPSGSVYKIR